jgi:caffeoyl-CoA O-methyltransferase
MANQLPAKLGEYLESLEASGHPVLREMEALARERRFPIIGPQCGRVLATLALAIGAQRVFEMGSGYGYSTLWFASVVPEVTHTDGDPANTELAKTYLAKAGLIEKCRFLTGDANELLAAESGTFDVILIDIDKQDYPLALQVAVQKVRTGGLILTHNVIWSGRVASESDEAATQGIQQYNLEIMSHEELLSFIDPTDDGLAVSLKVTPDTRRALFP